jgi:hypothetical protein
MTHNNESSLKSPGFISNPPLRLLLSSSTTWVQVSEHRSSDRFAWSTQENRSSSQIVVQKVKRNSDPLTRTGQKSTWTVRYATGKI